MSGISARQPLVPGLLDSEDEDDAPRAGLDRWTLFAAGLIATAMALLVWAATSF
jgi:hypothetical protein